MAGWWPMLLFLGILFGSMMFILFAGYVRIEAERAEAAREKANGSAQPEALPQFLLLAPAAREELTEEVEDTVLERVQRHLVREQREVADFVARPSVKRLYRGSQRRIRAASVGRYLAREQAAVASFVSDPSVETLYRDSSRFPG